MMQKPLRVISPFPRAQARVSKRQINPRVGLGAITVIWIGYFALIVASPGTLLNMWQHLLNMALVHRLVVGALFLPWTAATWIWQSTWSGTSQVLTITMVVIGTLIAFRPTETN